jgi:hypothetical protein
MSLHDRLSDDLKTAMKARDQLRMDVIRMIKAAILNKELELKKQLDDAEMSRVMTALLTQRREAAEQYRRANRTDLAERELREITILEGYLPGVPSAEEVRAAVERAVQAAGASSLKDLGAVMKQVMAAFAGRAVDGRLASDMVRARLQP